MKILFLYDYLPFKSDAVGNLINNIAPYFAKFGHEVYIASTKSSYADKKVIEFSSFKILSVNYVLNKILGKDNVLDCLHYYGRRIKNRLKKEQKQGLFNELQVKIYSNFLRKVYKKYKFDVIVPICSNYLWLESAIKFKESSKYNVKIALYQVDPFLENFNKKNFDEKILNDFEERLYENCSIIFTTPIIYNLKELANKNTDKLVPVELPGIKKQTVSASQRKQGDEIRCIFSGFLYKQIRNPEFMFKLFSEFKNKNIKLYLIGSGCEDIVKEHQAGMLKDRLITVGRLNVLDNANWLDSADVLINIGNLVENQVPSKIFNYFSMGKPIINICKIDNCSCKKYMNKYPLAINVNETLNITQEVVEQAENFILNSLNKTISFDEVEKIFYDCTPKYVVETMLNNL